MIAAVPIIRMTTLIAKRVIGEEVVQGVMKLPRFVMFGSFNTEPANDNWVPDSANAQYELEPADVRDAMKNRKLATKPRGPAIDREMKT